MPSQSPLQLGLFEDSPEPRRPEPRRPAGVLVGHGALATEALLFERVEALAAEAARDPALLARPVRVVVPSRSLRLHVAAALVERRGRSLAGVAVQTLRALALEVLERAGETAPRGAMLFDLLAQRFARGERALSGLEELVDGYAGAAATVRDLLDAGLEGAHAEAAEEALAAEGPRVASRAAVERARALVRVAARVDAAGEALGLGRAAGLFRRAAALLGGDPDRLLPARAVLIHGFADATGLATDLLQALLRRGGLLLLDHPPDPARPELGIIEAAFTERFARRLALVTRFEEASPPSLAPAPPPRIEKLEAPGAEAEARAVARRLRELLDAGIRPERIAVVARDLARCRLPLRRHLRRLGIPFSGVGARGSIEPAGRRLRALLELLRRGEETPADRWLDALVSLPPAPGEADRVRLPAGGRRRVDLRLAFYALGAGRLRDLAAVEVAPLLDRKGRYPLPVRLGLQAMEKAEEEDRPAASRAARRTVPGAEVERARAAAQALCDAFRAWPRQARAAEHLERLAGLLEGELGWARSHPGTAPVFTALAELAAEVPAGLTLSWEELRLLVGRALAEAGTSPLGGGGGGVQVLTVTEARGRTFDHLFLAGLNRDVFPRTVREDPLLPDSLRLVLRGAQGDGVLPDVPVKRTGFDEERYLFAQLLSAAPVAVLSWQVVDEDGRALPASPLVERLLAAGPAVRAHPLYIAPYQGVLGVLGTGASESLRPADEHAVIAALHGPRRLLGPPLAAAMAEAAGARAGLPGARPLDPDALAAARLAVLDEIDPDRRTPEGRAARARLGPFFGYLGSLRPDHDPRARDLYVTHLENMAACPWQTFLVRLLGIEPTPDPLQALPGLDAMLLGNLVHAVLERIVLDAAPEGWQGETPDRPAWRDGAPVAVPWPEPGRLEALLAEQARRVAREEGIPLPGLARALAERARPFLAAAREADWSDDPLPVLAVEARGRLTVRDGAGREWTVSFKADRVDRGPDGELRFTDYKTGKPLSEGKKPETRRGHFLEKVRAGRFLQAQAYHLAAGEPGAQGRYLYLKPEVPFREFVAGREDAGFAAAFEGAVAAVLDSWQAGAFFPRVVDVDGRKEPARCSFCDVAEACLRGDSGSRMRLAEWVEKGGEETHPIPAASTALLRLWRLAAGVLGGAEGAEAAE